MKVQQKQRGGEHITVETIFFCVYVCVKILERERTISEIRFDYRACVTMDGVYFNLVETTKCGRQKNKKRKTNNVRNLFEKGLNKRRTTFID